MVVPARDEARNIERCLRSLLASTYPRLEILVVDDCSTDGTRAIVERLATSDGRVRLVPGQPLPGGWFGKPWACWQGYRAARGGLLLFTDADTTHGPALHGHAVGHLLAERAHLVTVLPRELALTFWERLVQPHFFVLLGIRYGSAERLNRNTDPRHAIANGQFILVTRESYEALGGHQAVKDQVVEDLALAQAYTAAGLAVRFAGAEQVMATRMYASLREIVDGWTKNAFNGMRRGGGARVGGDDGGDAAPHARAAVVCAALPARRPGDGVHPAARRPARGTEDRVEGAEILAPHPCVGLRCQVSGVWCCELGTPRRERRRDD